MFDWRRSALFSGLSLNQLGRAVGRAPTEDLSRAESSSTLFRFFRSKHVRDLKLIAALALAVLSIHFFLAVFFGLLSVTNTPAKGASGAAMQSPATGTPNAAPQAAASNSEQKPARSENAASGFFSFVVTHFGSALPIYDVIMGWAYQSASKRLGIVDLFACEIGTLCRVGTIFDIGKRFVDMHDVTAPEKLEWGAGKFVSQEDYFPVFEGNSRDLQLLDASVVETITAFYTYMKAVRDTRRRLADTKPPQAGDAGMPDDPTRKDPWRAGVVNIIYMIYLGYESARKAIADLVEFQPDAAERAIVILLTELKCYGFLLTSFSGDDVRARRLRLSRSGVQGRGAGALPDGHVIAWKK